MVPLLLGNNGTLRTTFLPMDENTGVILNALSGLLGTVTMDRSIQIAWIARVPFRRLERWSRTALALSLTAWAVFEFCFKLTHGINGTGLVAHFGLLLAFALSLLAKYRTFHALGISATTSG